MCASCPAPGRQTQPNDPRTGGGRQPFKSSDERSFALSDCGAIQATDVLSSPGAVEMGIYLGLAVVWVVRRADGGTDFQLFMAKFAVRQPEAVRPATVDPQP